MTAISDEPKTSLGEIVLLSSLHPSPLNPRKRFDPASMRELEENIKKHGVIVPLLVRRSEVIDGERRFRAAGRAGLELVPVVFRNDLTDGEVIEIQLLSAIQRQDLTPLEEAAGFKSLIDSNPSHYSPAYIADRVGRSERWVWDRMQLLHLIPALQQHLDADRLLVGHAEVLAKLKPADQARLNEDIGGGLWEPSFADLAFDDDDDDESDPHRHAKARTVKELESWIARHIRFDVHHAAATAPFDFGPVAAQVDEALATSGRGKKVVPITFEYAVHPDAKSDERTFGQSAWKRADGRDADAPVCDHAVLGTVVAGRHYGQAFKVCVARDKCEVHWKAEITAREKNATLRQHGHGSRATQNEVMDQAKQKELHAENTRRAQAWATLEVLLDTEAMRQVKTIKALTAAHASFIGQCDIYGSADAAETHLGKRWFKVPATAWLVTAVAGRPHCEDFPAYLKTIVKPLGLTAKPFQAIHDQVTKPAPATAKQKSPPPKKAKKRSGR